MKKLYFLLFSLIGCVAFGQDLVITGAYDGPLSGGTPKGVELYVINNIADLSTYGIGSANNGGGTDGVEFTFPADAATAGSFIYVATEAVEFANFFGFAPDYTSGAMGINGDDAVELFSDVDTTPVVIDVFGTIDCDPNSGGSPCPEWEHTDGWAYRVNGTGPEGSTFTSTNWTYSGTNQLEGGATNAACTVPFPIGTYTTAGSSCGVTLGAASIVCSTNTIGDNNDDVVILISYTGVDAGITSVSTSSTGVIGGDDPSTTSDGTITITGLSEGDAWDIVLNGGDCDGRTVSGTVGAAECDPTPNTCFDLSGGTELFESVSVTTNSDTDEWTESSGTYTMNGFCGGGCMEESNTWLIFGPLNMAGVSDLSLIFDAAEGFDGSTLDIQYTSDYSSLCPDGATWTSAQTISDAGSYSVDISGASGTDVFIGIQYLDSDGSFSSWSLSNVSIGAFGVCPTLGSRPTSDCATCDVSLQTETYTCITNTAGDNNDDVTINIAYTGSESTITSLTTTSSGVIGGDDPATVADGTITITGLSEGDAWDITINGGDCDATTMSGTVPSAVCDPVFLVINEINADPDATNGDANGDGTVDTSQDEFIELYNTGSTSIDLTDYTISDGASLRHTFPAGSILPANSFITVFGGGTPTGINGIVQTASTGSVGLNNGGDTITITDNNAIDIIVEVYTNAGNNQSIGRSPDFTGAFVDHTSIAGNGGALFSPGLENDDVTLSDNEFTATSFSIYPNPSNGREITISSPQSEAISVIGYDILGKQVLSATISNNTLDVSQLKSGIYILKITQNNASTTKKLVIR
ncbi:lamin tail domain-containing protein [uncultured Winogradskyella sp.]|uniref:lamin tail domain-containing protein n=1 Tax=uncultured Winogradskyella sp. TaxID=395353 RepID=UPI0026168C6B|nr:lamin tail domain-containing protein [uncultured Winogradskyella sp.]